MTKRVRRVLVLGAFMVLPVFVVRGLHAASACPGDLNNDGEVTVDEIIQAVNASLNGCPVGPLSPSAPLLQTGQTECDQGSGDLGPCPGSPSGQDGAVGAGVPLSYVDNSDGTVTDTATGLMWEKLADDGGIHDWENSYTWSDAFTVKVAALNQPPCFAGHCDWRLPNRRELDSLVDAGRRAPAINPVFATDCAPDCTVTSCSCVQSDYYWTSTTYLDEANFAWAVDGNLGYISAYEKTLAYFVRAVRG